MVTPIVLRIIIYTDPASKHPTDDEREALKSYFYLTSRLYPCGECAAEFQQLFRALSTANVLPSFGISMVSFTVSHITLFDFIFVPLGCVSFTTRSMNRLQKPIFDCAHLDDEYDCGCGDDAQTPTTSPSPIYDQRRSDRRRSYKRWLRAIKLSLVDSFGVL